MDIPLVDEAIRLRVAVGDWRGAIRQAGDALVACGATTPAYTDDMITAVEQLGPYIVIAPGVALAHARPSAAVLRVGCSWVTLSHPVDFGNAANDPFRVVIGLAAIDHDGHLQLMAALADLLMDEDRLSLAVAAETPGRLREVLAGKDAS